EGPSPDMAEHPTVFKLGNWDLTEPGFATYRGVGNDGQAREVRFPLEGRNRKLLACLVRGRGRPVSAASLRKACDSNMEDHSLSGAVSRLRTHLRYHLADFPLLEDPIPCRDPDAYQLLLT